MLFGLTFAVYHRSIGFTFFADDFFVLDLISEGPLKALLPSRNVYHYFPVFLLLAGVPRWLGIGQPGVYHVLILLIHSANSVLVYHIARRLLGSRFHASGAALIFSLFFMSYDPVLWTLSGSFYVMSLFFALLSFASFLQYRINGRRFYLLGFPAFYIIAIYTNELTAPILGVCLLYDLTRRSEDEFSLLRSWLSTSWLYVGPAVAIVVLSIIKHLFTSKILVAHNSPLKLAQNFVSAACFLSPFNNTTAYWLFSKIGQNWMCVVAGSVTMVVVLVVCLAKGNQGQRVALAWVSLCVLPAILLAELSPRYFYIPAAGWAIFWAGTAQADTEWMKGRPLFKRQERFPEERALLAFVAAGLIYACVALQGYRHIAHLIDLWGQGSAIIQEATQSTADLIIQYPSKKKVIVVDQPVWLQADDFYGAPLLIDSMSLPLKGLLNIDRPGIKGVAYESDSPFSYFPKVTQEELQAIAADPETLVIRYDPNKRRMVPMETLQ
ncbi:MAG: hypothetical protein HY801_10485 [Candidatus Lindowbacteria bacterium]|nr:hypothetical protein [Candidatus Lindowbacteria bacterium]